MFFGKKELTENYHKIVNFIEENPSGRAVADYRWWRDDWMEFRYENKEIFIKKGNPYALLRVDRRGAPEKLPLNRYEVKTLLGLLKSMYQKQQDAQRANILSDFFNNTREG